jgi:radical SAM protein with 4Fe4S-binding SPASM domain
MKHFDSVYIEITNTCNLSCSFCPGTNRKKQYMDAELFKRILKEFKDRCSFIFFHVMGEPLLHPDLENFLSLADDYNHRVNITTNGILLKENLEILKNAPALRQVNVSLHWLEEIKDKAFIEKYMSHLFHFIRETRSKADYFIALRLWNMDEGGFNKNNRVVARAIDREFHLDASVIDTKATYKGMLLDKNIFLNHDIAFQWPKINNEKDSGRGFCRGLRSQVAVLADGTVVPCCLDNEGTINLGSILHENIDEIIHSQRATALYEGFSQGKAVEPLCRSCGYKSLFTKKIIDTQPGHMSCQQPSPLQLHQSVFQQPDMYHRQVIRYRTPESHPLYYKEILPGCEYVHQILQ